MPSVPPGRRATSLPTGARGCQTERPLLRLASLAVPTKDEEAATTLDQPDGSWRTGASCGLVLWLRMLAASSTALLALATITSGVAQGAPGLEGQPVPGTSSLTGIACMTPTTCIAVGRSSAGGVVVVIDNGVPESPQAVPGLENLADVACPTATTCEAVGWDPSPPGPVDTGPAAVVPIVNGTPGTPQTVPESGGVEPHAVACVRATDCEAVAATGGGFGVYVVITDGTPGKPQVLDGGLVEDLEGIACPTTAECLATTVGEVVPITDGVAGTPALMPEPEADLREVACPSSTDCLAAAYDNNGTGAVVPITGGTPGAALSVPGTLDLQGVACSSVSACVAVGQNASNTSGDLVPITNGSPGAPQDVSGTADLVDATCEESGACLAVGWESSAGFRGVVVASTSTGCPVADTGTAPNCQSQQTTTSGTTPSGGSPGSSGCASTLSSPSRGSGGGLNSELFGVFGCELIGAPSHGAIALNCGLTPALCPQSGPQVHQCTSDPASCGSYGSDVVGWMLANTATSIALGQIPCASLGSDAAGAVEALVATANQPMTTDQVSMSGGALATISLAQASGDLVTAGETGSGVAKCALIASTGAGVAYAIVAGAVGAIVTIFLPNDVEYTFVPESLNQSSPQIDGERLDTLYVTSKYSASLPSSGEPGICQQPPSDTITPNACLSQPQGNGLLEQQPLSTSCSGLPKGVGEPVSFAPVDMIFSGVGHARAYSEFSATTGGRIWQDVGVGQAVPVVSDACGRVQLSYTPAGSPTEQEWVCNNGVPYTVPGGIPPNSECTIETVQVPQDTITAEDPIQGLLNTKDLNYVYAASGSHVHPSPPPGVINWVNASSNAVNGTLLATDGSISAYANSDGSVTLSNYASDPVALPQMDVTGGYFEVRAIPANANGGRLSSRASAVRASSRRRHVTTLTIRVCDLPHQARLLWWQSPSKQITGRWRLVIRQRYVAADGCIVATVGQAGSSSFRKGLVLTVGSPVKSAYVDLQARKHDHREQVSAVAQRRGPSARDWLAIVDLATGTVVRNCGIRSRCSVNLPADQVSETLIGELVSPRRGRLDASSVTLVIP